MIRSAQESDAETLVALINSAFLVERFFIEQDRVDLEGVREFLKQGTFLIAEEDGRPVACVYLEVRNERGYFGLLSVDPPRQGSGLGKRLIATAEDYCREAGCAFMDIRIVNLREELPAFYRKLGYAETGTAPFPVDTVTNCRALRGDVETVLGRVELVIVAGCDRGGRSGGRRYQGRRVISHHVVLHGDFSPAHAETLGFQQGLLIVPPVMRDSIASDHCSRAICAAAAMHKHRSI